MKVSVELKVVYFSATITTYTGGNLTADGEPCEPGCGNTIAEGHWNPSRSYWTVHPSRDDVTPDSYPVRRRPDPAVWLASRISGRLGLLDTYDGWHTFYSQLEAIHPHRLTGPSSHDPGAVLGSGTFACDIIAAERLRPAKPGQRTITAAAHAYGFTDGELQQAAILLGTGWSRRNLTCQPVLFGPGSLRSRAYLPWTGRKPEW